MIQETTDLRELLHGKMAAVMPSEDFVTAALLVDCHCELGEGVTFDMQTNTVLWTDILGCKLHTLHLQDPSKVVFSTYPLPQKLGSFGLLEPTTTTTSSSSSLPLLCAFQDGFQLYDVIQQKALSEKSQGEDVNPAKGTSRLNDGRVDPTGQRFVAGGYFGGLPGVQMKVFCCEQKEDGCLVHEPLVDNIQVTQQYCLEFRRHHHVLGGLANQTNSCLPLRQSHWNCFNPEEKTATPQGSGQSQCSGRQLRRRGGISLERRVAQRARLRAWSNGSIPQRDRWSLPSTLPDATSQVTCCCFGGPDLDILFITTAAESVDPVKEPHAGGLYAVKLTYHGRPESRLQFRIKA